MSAESANTIPILRVNGLTKTYNSAGSPLTVLDHVSFDIPQGISCAIIGPSGSGKTTLLGLCAGLDQPSEGGVELAGNPLNGKTEDQLAKIRNQHVGFIFQSFQLIPTLTAVENVMVPVELRGGDYQTVYEKAIVLLKDVGLGHRLDHYPTQLSGGEQQRVAIARAFINDPEILFADEPTGNLDTETGQQVESILFDLNKRQGTTLVIVTHDNELAAKCDRIIRLKAGKIERDELTAEATSAEAVTPELNA
ncbi:MAG: ABC transporter ATP-binding protein [Balneolia bacterium]|nr:ABC transporter ATP-binding protein [Balneolia bacterium]